MTKGQPGKEVGWPDRRQIIVGHSTELLLGKKTTSVGISPAIWSLELMRMSWPFPGCPCYDVWQGNRYEPKLNLVKHSQSGFHRRCSSDSNSSLCSISVMSSFFKQKRKNSTSL